MPEFAICCHSGSVSTLKISAMSKHIRTTSSEANDDDDDNDGKGDSWIIESGGA